VTPLDIPLRTIPTETLRARLTVFIVWDEGKAIREELNRRARESYQRQNELEDYMKFMNDHECSFDVNGWQCQNSPYYYTMFSVVSQHVRGDCVEECLDKAMEIANGKRPR